MLKEERHRLILDKVKQKGVVKVIDLTEALNVSDMTIRRDLVELEEKGKLIRIHGGAKNIENIPNLELSHLQKQQLNIDAKREVAQKIVNSIVDNDVIFLGPGTTIELVPALLTQSNLKIVTNSLPVFNELRKESKYEIILIGGTYRDLTGAFAGGMANLVVETIRTGKAFIGVNGIYNNIITNYNEEEGNTQKMILDNAIEKYIIADTSKLNKLDFFQFYDLREITALITDDDISEEDFDKYSKFTHII